jgi:plastocyanin
MRLRRLVMGAGLVAVTACGGGGSMSQSTGGSSPQVMIADFSFLPSTMTVKAGTTVTWINNGPSGHATTSDTMTWDSPPLAPPTGGGGYGGAPGGSFTFTFNTPGTYHYHCRLHPPASYPGFTGTITVT